MVTAFYDDVDAGVSGVCRWALNRVGERVTDFGVLRDFFDDAGRLLRYVSPVKWLEVGTPEALAHARRELGVRFDNDPWQR